MNVYANEYFKWGIFYQISANINTKTHFLKGKQNLNAFNKLKSSTKLL